MICRNSFKVVANGNISHQLITNKCNFLPKKVLLEQNDLDLVHILFYKHFHILNKYFKTLYISFLYPIIFLFNCLEIYITAQKMRFSIADLLKKSVMENFIFCAVYRAASKTAATQRIRPNSSKIHKRYCKRVNVTLQL